jgi:predicted enzyme related to lactoylglutathione lyase
MSNNGIVHFEIPAGNPGKLSKFYQDVFGWQAQKWDMPGEGGQTMEYWGIRTVESNEMGIPNEPGAINGAIHQRMGPEQHPVNYINVPSIDEYLQKATSQGAKQLVAKTPVPQMGYFAQFEDPEGNTMGLWQNDPNAG